MSPTGGDRKSARGLAAEGHVPHMYVFVITLYLIASAHGWAAVSDGCQGVAAHVSQASRGSLKSIGGSTGSYAVDLCGVRVVDVRLQI